MDGLDLNIDDYNYNELLNIYGLTDINDKNILPRMDDKLITVKKKFPSNIYDFYFKTHKIISVLHLLYQKNKIQNLNEISDCIKYIKSIHLFEKETNENLENQLTNNLLNNKDKELIEIPNNPVGIANNNTNIVVDNYSNDLAPGNLNSLKRITQKMNLNLNSCFRDNYGSSTSSNFNYTIPMVIRNVTSIRLASIEMPCCWYPFYENSFTIEVTISNVTTSYTITIPNGNYTASQLETYLNSTYFYGSTTPTDLSHIAFTINENTCKSNFEVISTAPANYSFSIIFSSTNNIYNMMKTIGWNLGFRQGSYTNITTYVLSEGLYDDGCDRYIYLVVNDYQYNSNASNIVGLNESIIEDNIIAKIPMVYGKLSLIIDDDCNPLTKTRKYNGPVNIRNLQIKLLDKFGNVIDLNNMDFGFTLELELLYEGFNFNNITF